jgi:hypothetical protein
MKKPMVWTPEGEVAVSSSGVSNPSVHELGAIFEQFAKERSKDREPVVATRIHIPDDKVDLAITFWKPKYFDYLVDGRHLNGIEAYDLGDPKKTERPNQVPYIAMCNLMALEAVRKMGDQSPTTEDADLLIFGTEREREIADFWKQTFAPTLFQSQWAWKGALAIMAGSKIAFSEFLENYRDQLP